MPLSKVNFSIVSDMTSLYARDFGLADPATLLNPTGALALLDGEWVTLDNTPSTLGKLVRATDVTTPGALASKLAFPVWAERGRTDVQASSEKRVPVIFMGGYEADSRVFDAAVTAGGAAISSMLQPVCLGTITIGGRNYTGLVGSSYTSNNLVVGYVTRLPSANGGKLRFLSGAAVRNGTT